MKKNKHCKCGKLIWNCSERCPKCRSKIYSGKNHPSYKTGKPHCKICGKEIKYKSKLCHKCNITHNNPMYKKAAINKNIQKRKNYKHSINTKLKLSQIRSKWWKNLSINKYNKICKQHKISIKKVKSHKHHLDLNHNNNNRDNIIILSVKTHHKLHINAYKYLVYTKQIKKYLKWFNKYVKKSRKKNG